MKDFKIGHVVLQIEFQRLNKDGEVVEKLTIPNQQLQQSIVFLGAELPKNMKDLIFSKLNSNEQQKKQGE